VKRFLPFSRRAIRLILLAATLCVGCRREKIAVYDIPKESAANSQMAAAPDAGPLPIKFQVPTDWKSEPAGEMSLATFSMSDRKAELAVMSFPGEGASQLSLINVVRDNEHQPPLSDAELAKLQETVPIGPEKGALVDITAGTSTNVVGKRILLAVTAHSGITWFFKFAGDSSVIATRKPELLSFLKSVEFTAVPDAAATANMASDPHAGLGPNPHGGGFTSANSGGMTPPPGASLPPSPVSDKPKWDVPNDWNEESATQVGLAKFNIHGQSGDADVTVTAFGGGAGGLLANIVRWRGQVGLPPITEADLEKSYTSLDVPDGKAMLVDVNGTKNGKATRIIGVVWPRGQQTWFYKMMGDASVVDHEKDAFLKFIQSVRYPDA
jgi:hypothetical protein